MDSGCEKPLFAMEKKTTEMISVFVTATIQQTACLIISRYWFLKLPQRKLGNRPDQRKK
jgi:hypothetical protein